MPLIYFYFLLVSLICFILIGFDKNAARNRKRRIPETTLLLWCLFGGGIGGGIGMTVNKHQKVRAALCWMKEIAALARLHNDANVISIPARYTSVPQAVEMVETFLNTEFEGGRHQNRVNKIACQ